MLINLTAHPITLDNKGVTQVIPPSGKELRVIYIFYWEGEVEGIAIRALRPDTLCLITKTDQGIETEPLPDQKEDVYYIISALAYMQAFPLHRSDLFCPDTDQAVKNEKGHVLSVPGFVTYNLGNVNSVFGEE